MQGSATVVPHGLDLTMDDEEEEGSSSSPWLTIDFDDIRRWAVRETGVLELWLAGEGDDGRLVEVRRFAGMAEAERLGAELGDAALLRLGEQDKPPPSRP